MKLALAKIKNGKKIKRAMENIQKYIFSDRKITK